MDPHVFEKEKKRKNVGFTAGNIETLRQYRQLIRGQGRSHCFPASRRQHFGRVYDDFVRLIFFHVYGETSILYGELPEESPEQFRFLSPMNQNLVTSTFGKY